MNKAARMIAMSGIAVAAGLAVGVGPAVAAPVAPAAPAAPSAPAAAASASDHKFAPSRSKTVGYYRNAATCLRVGKVGEFQRKWDDFDCNRVQRGFKRGSWVLVAKWHRFGHNKPGHSHGRPTHGLPTHGQPTHGQPVQGHRPGHR